LLRPVFLFIFKSMAGGRPTKYKPEFCEIAIECGKQGMGKAEIASKLGVVRETLWDWGNKKPEFSNALKRAYEEGLSWWERKGREATFGGVEGFNSTSYIFQMKNRFKEDWRDKHDHSVEVSGEIEIVIGGEDE